MPHLDTLAYSHILTSFYMMFLFSLMLAHKNIAKMEKSNKMMMNLQTMNEYNN